MEIDGGVISALIDSGCSISLIGENWVKGRSRGRDTVRLEVMGGGSLVAAGSVVLKSIRVDGVELGPVKAFVVPSLPLGVGFVVGLDVILRHGMAVRSAAGRVEVIFGEDADRHVGSAVGTLGGTQTQELQVDDEDFNAFFKDGRWTVRWRWNGQALTSPTAEAGTPEIVSNRDREAFDAELKSWLDEGILVRHSEEDHGPIKHRLPLIAVRQAKGAVVKVRPVLDYRRLNGVIESHPGGATPICADVLRRWRQLGPRCAMMDLRRAYLQIYVDKEQWNYQAVRWNGVDYLLTRLGFGLSSAPKIMTKVIEAVIGVDARMEKAVSGYIDDLYIDESMVKVSEVAEHFRRWGLSAKPPERLGEELRILGLKVDGRLKWSRDGELPSIPENPTRRDVHKLVGVWCGHFPVANWLRVACGYIQRQTASEGLKWDEIVPTHLVERLQEVDVRLRQNDPAHGSWLVDDKAPLVIWADASSLAVGVALEVDGSIVEDAAWMRPKSDCRHINCAELDAVLRGLNMALRWGRRTITIKTDSATVFGWLQATFKKTHNIRTRALSEVLIRRRLGIIQAVVEGESLVVDVDLVRSEDNKADELTRVPQRWLKDEKQSSDGLVAGFSLHDVERIHNTCHFGTEKTLQLARERYGASVSRRMAKKVVSRCDVCRKIDPPLVFRYDHGQIASRGVWDKMAIDLVHVGSQLYLSAVDVFSGFTIWSRLRDESGSEVTQQMRQVFFHVRPP